MVTQRFFIEKMGEEGDLSGEMLRKPSAAWERLEQMTAYCQTDQCLRASHTSLFWRNVGGSLRSLRQLPAPGGIADATHLALPVLPASRRSTGALARASSARSCWAARSARAGDGAGSLAALWSAQGRTRQILSDVIDEMIERGYLASTGGKYAVVRLGARAQAALEGEGGDAARKRAGAGAPRSAA